MTSRIRAIQAYRPRVKIERTVQLDELVRYIAGHTGRYSLSDLSSHHSSCAESVGGKHPTYRLHQQDFPRCGG